MFTIVFSSACEKGPCPMSWSIIAIKEASGDMEQIIANNEKIKNVLKWKPGKNNLKKIVKSSLKWEKVKLY